MYDFLRGIVVESRPTRLVLDVNGVGFDLIVPAGSGFPAEGKVDVPVHLVVREDAQLLYGFKDRETRELFRLLLRVKQVGPSTAIAILSGLSREEFVEAVRTGDAARLTKAKGVGRKTADQILLDLSGRFDPTAAPARVGAGTGSLVDDAVGALVSIGYSEKEARKSAEKAAKEVGTADLDVLLRAALRG
jgi:Holliday junction DNA helicase RuvA